MELLSSTGEMELGTLLYGLCATDTLEEELLSGANSLELVLWILPVPVGKPEGEYWNASSILFAATSIGVC